MKSEAQLKRRRKHRILAYSLLAILGLAFVLPLMSYTAHFLGYEAVAQDSGSTAGSNPRSNFWGAVKDGLSGYSAVKGPETGMLIQPGNGGTQWQQTRAGDLSKKLPWVIAGMAVIILLYHLIFGRKNKLPARRTGRKIKRWSWFERLIHWITAISFIALAITGISMLIGKNVLIPVLGKAGFATWAGLSIQIHNILGPVFTVGVIMMIIMWVAHNIPTTTDLKWLAKGGGLFGSKHVSAGRMNAGEKIWFWLLATVGVVVCLTGVGMIAPIYGITLPAALDVLPWISGSRADMQQANLIHAALGIGWTAIALGHIYIGTAGSEGSFEAMSTGYVSEEWAREHHDLWFEKMQAKDRVMDADEFAGIREGLARASASEGAVRRVRSGTRSAPAN